MVQRVDRPYLSSIVLVHLTGRSFFRIYVDGCSSLLAGTMLSLKNAVCFVFLLISPFVSSLSIRPAFVLPKQRKLAREMAKVSTDDLSPSDEVVGEMKGGLTFLKTRDRQEIVDFYTSKIGMTVWLEQPNITILAFGNLLIGWNQLPEETKEPDLAGMYTFVYPSKEEVDQMYSIFKDTSADGPPRYNPRYQIYQFFAKDPEGRALEFQAFLHPLTAASSAVRA